MQQPDWHWAKVEAVQEPPLPAPEPEPPVLPPPEGAPPKQTE